MEMDAEKDKILKFVKTGLIVLSVLLLCTSLYHFTSRMVSVSNNAGKKELPIYCVDRADNKVGLSFDAAWGEV